MPGLVQPDADHWVVQVTGLSAVRHSHVHRPFEISPQPARLGGCRQRQSGLGTGVEQPHPGTLPARELAAVQDYDARAEVTPDPAAGPELDGLVAEAKVGQLPPGDDKVLSRRKWPQLERQATG
jgi:hypothetical protein